MMKQPELGRKIVSLRKQLGLTQEELVDRCNLNVRTLQRIESGEVNPRSHTIKSIFDALDYEEASTASGKYQRAKDFLELNAKKYFSQIINEETMTHTKVYFQRFFLATGFIYLIFAISRLTWEAHHIRVEELLTLIIPAAYATFRIFEDQRQKRKPEEVYNYSGGLLTTYFLALGIVWFFSLLSVYIFKITIGTTEFYWTLFLPLFYAISTRFRKNRKTQADSE